MQQGMLFHRLLARHPGEDVEQIIIILPEAMNLRAFEQAWRQAAKRHEILRTGFRWEGVEQPQQEIRTSVRVELTWHDWSSRPAGGQEQAWEDLLTRDRRQGFRLESAPLWRLSVARTAAREHRLLFTFHHILLDGRGLVALLLDVFALYEAGKARQAVALAPAIPYHNYLRWLGTQDWKSSEPFWRRALKDLDHPTPLPGALSPARPAEPDQLVHREQHVRLSSVRTRALRELAGRHGFTLNTLVLGAWALLLGRYSGEDDVTFGAVRACRHTTVEGADAIVGLLINTVPFRVALPPGQPAVEWLQGLREQWVALRPHENTPLSVLQGWSAVPAGTPLFESLVNYQEPRWDAALQAQGGAWRHRRFDIRSQPAYPLALDAAGGATLSLKLLYQPHRFTGGTIRRMLGHLVTLLQGIADRPDTPLAALPLLTAPERRQILADWNLTHAEYPADLCVHHLFEEQAARTPAALAVTDETRHLTYGELHAQAGTLARELHALGVGPDVCVAVCLPRSVDLVVSQLAVLKAGGCFVPLDPAYPAERLATMAMDAQSRVLLTQRRFARLFPALAQRIICLDAPFHSLDQADRPRAPVQALPLVPSPRNLAYVIYTSGSTGRPKGVAVTHGSLVNLLTWHQCAYQVTAADRVTLLASPAFDASVWELWPYLTCGASVHIPPEEVRAEPAQLVPWLAGRMITLCFLPTPLAEAVLDETWPPDTALRAILTGGDRLRRWPGDRLPCPLFNHYGPTENTVVATAGVVPTEPDGDGPPSIGTPIANTEVLVLDRHRQPVPVGVAGELYVGGAGLARGYHRQPGLTQDKFVPHPFKPGVRLYRTGDRVCWRTDGRLDFLGRLDQQIKVRGHRIEPAEIETVLNAHPAVRESLVLAHEADGTARLVAYFVPAADQFPPDTAELAGMLRARLPAFMVPESFVALAAWPLTANGKVDRPRLPAPETASAPAGFAPLQGAAQETVARIWSEVLGRTGFGAQDDFFALGGHSLRAAQVVSRLNAAFQARLTVRHLFEHPTIAGLARVCEEAAGRGARHPAPLVRQRRPNRRTQLSAQS